MNMNKISCPAGGTAPPMRTSLGKPTHSHPIPSPCSHRSPERTDRGEGGTFLYSHPTNEEGSRRTHPLPPHPLPSLSPEPGVRKNGGEGAPRRARSRGRRSGGTRRRCGAFRPVASWRPCRTPGTSVGPTAHRRGGLVHSSTSPPPLQMK